MQNRHRFAVRRSGQRLLIGFAGLLALTTPVWIERLAGAEPAIAPVADLIGSEPSGRVLPADALDGVRIRLDSMRRALESEQRPALDAKEYDHQGQFPAVGDDSVAPLPRSLETAPRKR